MRIPTSLSSILLTSALLPSFSVASGFDCAHINAEGFKYDLSPLGGVHSLYNVEKTEEHVLNTTYVLNICNILKGASIRGHLKCGTSKNICGFQYKYPIDGSEETSRAFPIVGLEHLGHGSKDPEITRLNKLDAAEEGLLVKLSGGTYVDDEGKKKDARAIVKFQCDLERSGLEGLKTANDEKIEEERRRRRREEGGDKEQPSDEEKDRSQSLQFKSFGKADDDTYVLKLDWKTRYACDHYLEDKKGDSSGHWGFLTWLIIILFLCIAAYLIFGSWLNYNRYGARGWDLLPHGDTIRDIPYIFQDWLRRVINTLQGTGSRGGYSAV
ncbi:autophagy-related protein 27 [Aspergillus coremiiformis]|uniref:Autophagy-related protein 27 n=1 Tax=Aspergillus coremiiformis TaxID=138285 RepID=A0A5N6Z6S5_9EURO|nr:autophagy-related protein 27 [Aspergillus coremiiformis]